MFATPRGKKCDISSSRTSCCRLLAGREFGPGKPGRTAETVD